jgi:hypothetical protein
MFPKQFHIWNFHPTKTFIRLEDNFRKTLFDRVQVAIGFGKSADLLNQKSAKYKIGRKYSKSHFYAWRDGFKLDREKRKSVHVPLWVLMELSKSLAKSDQTDNEIMKRVEKNVISYSGRGKARSVLRPKLPVNLTPELVSIIFHICGDGHIGGTGPAHYAQINEVGLRNFYAKLNNCFGDAGKLKVEWLRCFIPEVIVDFYRHCFGLNKSRWHNARIPESVKRLPEPYLVAGLVAFIIDEGHIGGDIIEIYSGNRNLLNDIKEISRKLKYRCWGPKRKFRYGKPDSWRLYISVKDAMKLHKDIIGVSKQYPTCTLAHKTAVLEAIVARKERKITKTKDGISQKEILALLSTGPKTVSQLAAELKIGHSSMREHLYKLEKRKEVVRAGKSGKHALLFARPNMQF